MSVEIVFETHSWSEDNERGFATGCCPVAYPGVVASWHVSWVAGAGRFLVLTRDGEVGRNLVWTDTVLVRTGEVLDLLLDVTHAGRWMAHCHIAEHHESGMMLNFDVAEAEGAS